VLVIADQPSDRSSQPLAKSTLPQVAFIQAVIEGLIDGIIVVATDGDVIQFNTRAAKLCPTLNQEHSIKPSSNNTGPCNPFALPASIWRVCETLIESRELFPNQTIMLEAEEQLKSKQIRIRSQWLTIPFDGEVNPNAEASPPCILVTLEDRHETLKHLAIAEMQNHSLTRREGEIWQLRLQGMSYREIATQLYITEHTVRKHVKNILAKRRIV
jgi:DNA-binding CsgD family transcriptional regulator